MNISIFDKQLLFEGKLRMKICSPFLSNSNSLAYTFNVPFNDVNDAIFNRIRFAEIQDITTKYPCSITIGLFNIIGDLTIKKINKTYECFFIEKNTLKIFESKKLNTLQKLYTFQNQTTGYNQYNVITESWKEGSDFVFTKFKAPFYNNNFPVNISEAIQTDNNSLVFDDNFVLTPCFYLSFIIKQIFEQNNIRINENCFENDVDLTQLVVFSNMFPLKHSCELLNAAVFVSNIEKKESNTLVFHAANYMHYLNNNDMVAIIEYASPGQPKEPFNYYTVTVIDDASFSINNIDKITYDSYNWASNKYSFVKMSLINTFNEIDLSKHLPDLTIYEFLTAIETDLGIRFLVNEKLDEVSIIKVDDSLIENSFTDISDLEYSDFVFENTPIDGFSISRSADDNDSTFDSIKEFPENITIKGSATTKANLPNSGNTLNDVRLVTDQNIWYIFKIFTFNLTNSITINGYWDILTLNFKLKKELGNKDFVISSPISPMLIEFENTVGFEHYLKTNVAFNSYTFYNVSENKKIKLFFNRGHLIPFISNPLTTNDVYDFSGIKIPTANLSLNLDSPYSTYNRYYKNFIDWNLYFRKDAYSKIQWKMHLIYNMQWHKKYGIDNNAFYVKSIEFDCDNNDNITFYDTEIALC